MVTQIKYLAPYLTDINDSINAYYYIISLYIYEESIEWLRERKKNIYMIQNQMLRWVTVIKTQRKELGDKIYWVEKLEEIQGVLP